MQVTPKDESSSASMLNRRSENAGKSEGSLTRLHSRASKRPGLFSLIATSFVFISCTSFSGPGGYRPAKLPAAEESTISPGPTKPALEWSGERKTLSKPTTNVQFDWPVDEARLTRGFLLGRRSHWGIDLANTKGTSILAAESGVVIYTGHEFRGYGKLVVIEHNDEWATLYSHLSEILVKEGDQVARGKKIGTMGRTGRATGVHLHFEIRRNRQPVNPLAHLPEGF